MRIQSLLQQLPSVAWLPVLLLIILVLVAAHEYGHYLFARIFKMGIEEFAIGFGKRPLWIIGKKRVGIHLTPQEKESFLRRQAHGGDVQEKTLPFEGRGGVEPHEELVGDILYQDTAFTIRPWPLGGFVRIKGMMPEEDGSEVTIPGGFYSKPPWQRFLVLFAGPLFSVLAGVIVLTGVWSIAGKPVAVNEPVLESVDMKQPSGKAGLRPGDRILAIDGESTKTFFEIVKKVRESNGRTLLVTYDRGGEQGTVRLTPVPGPAPTPVLDENLESTGETKTQFYVGISPKKHNVSVGFLSALGEAAAVPWTVVTGIVSMFARPSTFSENVGGPATMAMATQASIENGADTVFWLAAMLSISIGILNLLPVPPLDGGQMLMAFLEMLRRGRRLSLQVQAVLATIGISLVIMLMCAVFVVDIRRLAHLDEKPSPAANAKPANAQGSGR